MIELIADLPGFERAGGQAIAAMTAAAVGSTYVADWMGEEEHAAMGRIVDLAGPSCRTAAMSRDQFFAAAFMEGRFAGYVIATVHAADDRELDWLMVHPDFHGTDVAAALMEAGMSWLGTDRPMWLNVVRHNARAIRFYGRFGFEIDPSTDLDRAIPVHVMRRSPTG